MTDGKEPRLPKPESLEAKFKLLALLPYDRRAKRKHALVFGFILDWYHSKYGNALASVRHVVDSLEDRDPAGRGLYAGDVHQALTDLVEWEFLHQEKGKGRRASRYVPNWSLVCSVRETPNTTADESSVQDSPNADVRDSPNTTADSVRDSTNEDLLTLTRPKDEVTCKEDNYSAAPAAPLTAGLSAADAETAEDEKPFEQLWRAYGVKKKRADARAAYDKLAPDAGHHATMIAAAKAWREAASDSVERMHLRRWIEQEEYECDPPTSFKTKDMPRKKVVPASPAKTPRSAAPAVEPQIIAANENRPTSADIPFLPNRTGIHAGNIVAAEAVAAVLTVKLDGGFQRDIRTEHSVQAVQDAGQAELAQLSAAFGCDIEDGSELVGLQVVVSEYADGSAKWRVKTDDADDLVNEAAA